MRRALSCLPLALLLIANVVPSKAQSAETTAAPALAAGAAAKAAPVGAAWAVAGAPGGSDDALEGGALMYYDLLHNATFNCTIPNPTKLPVIWSKNGTTLTDLPSLLPRVQLLNSSAVLHLPSAKEDDWGNYTCRVGDDSLAWRLHARVLTRLPSANTNVVEGQKLKLTCKVIGRPAPPVEWRYNESDAGNMILAVDALGADRVVLRDSDAGVVDGELLVETTRRSDAGRYVCVPLAPAAALSDKPHGHTTLRVKDMYAALWPFLGICAEVLVLCAVILVYEKRRTKPELDDSDTDNHDQKKS